MDITIPLFIIPVIVFLLILIILEIRRNKMMKEFYESLKEDENGALQQYKSFHRDLKYKSFHRDLNKKNIEKHEYFRSILKKHFSK
jgi:hypothetical protein